MRTLGVLPTAEGILVEIPDHVVGDEEVQPAVVVVVEPAGGDRPGLAELGMNSGHSRLDRHVGEVPVAVVAVQRVSIDPRHVEILPAVVVVVRGPRRHGIALSLDTGRQRHVAEGPVPLVTVEAVEVPRAPSFRAPESRRR